MEKEKKMPSEETISLVPGSVGARGYTHIGVIEALLEEGYDIQSVSGSSMGALIGGLYACGKLDAYKKWVLGFDLLNVAKLVDFSFTGTGIIQGEKVFDVINDMVGGVRIEELPIPFTAVAIDLIRQKEVWLQKGKLIDAIRASIAIPTIFTPKKIGERYPIDGGVLNPLHIAPTIADDTQLTIAVNLSANISKKYQIDISEKEQEKASGMQEVFLEMAKKAEKLFAREKTNDFDEMDMFDIMGHTIDIMQNAIMESKMSGYRPDVIIGVPNNACGFYEFNKAYEMIELGRLITREHLSENRDETA